MNVAPFAELTARFEIQRSLHHGEALQLFWAVEKETQNPVVLKCLSFDSLQNWTLLHQLEREAQLLQSMRYPRIPAYVDFLQTPGAFCLVQQALPGENLAQCLEKGPLPENEVIQIVAQLLCIVQALHAHRPPILHLDLKPSNLLWHEQTLYLIDFGAALLHQPDRHDISAAIAGTPGFTPPEQLAGQPRRASDLYAIGATCIALLSGLTLEHLIQDNKLVFREQLKCSVSLKNWLEIMVHIDPEMRFGSAEEALQHLPEIQSLALQSLPPRHLTQLSATALRNELTAHLHLDMPEYPGYRFQRCLKQAGGLATWLAEDHSAQAWVIKTLRFDQARMSEWVQFEREIQALQQLQHPRFPQLKEIRKQDNTWFMVLQYLPGETWAERVEANWQPEELEVWGLARQALEILAELHQARPALLHRDLCPENILWHEGQIYFLDFGGAQALGMSQGSGGSTLSGSFGFTAPEQYIGQASPSSDLFALGMCLIYLLSQRTPAHVRWENQEVAWQDWAAELHLSKALKTWLSRMTHLQPESRFADAQQALVTFNLQYERFLSDQNAEAAQTLEAKQARRQQLQAQQKAFDAGISWVSYQNQNHLWRDTLAKWGLDLPSLRLSLAEDLDCWQLTIPTVPLSRSARIEKGLKRAKQAMRFFPVLLGLGFLGFIIPPFLMAWFLAIYCLYLNYRIHSVAGAFLVDQVIALSQQQLHWQTQRSSYTTYRFMGGGKQHQAEIPLEHIRALSLQPSHVAAWLAHEGGAWYQLEIQRHKGPAIYSAPLYLKDSERLWLESALGSVLAHYQALA